MTEEAEVKPCFIPGCNQPGTKSCSACKSSPYCGPICQTADWPRHREECDGHLRKMGKAHLVKAERFHDQRNWAETLHYGEIAATKLKQLKDRRLETVELIDQALKCKFDALQQFDRHGEAMTCAEERYTLWAMNHMRNPGSMQAALRFIESCIHNKKFEDAVFFAREAFFMINDMADNFIPTDTLPYLVADSAYFLSQAIFCLTDHNSESITPEEKKKAGEEAIPLARKAMEMYSQQYGTENDRTANAMRNLGQALCYFNDVDDDEVIHLFEQALAMKRRTAGSFSKSVVIVVRHLGTTYERRAIRALKAYNTFAVSGVKTQADIRQVAIEVNRCKTNYELELTYAREAVQIYRAIGEMSNADKCLRRVADIEENIRRVSR